MDLACSEKKPQFRLGVYGGMGPLTGYDFFQMLVAKLSVGATCDTDHPDILFWSDPHIPRQDVCIEYLLREGAVPSEWDAMPRMQMGMRIFKHAEVSLIVAPCNTFHYFRADLERQAGIEILNMLAIVASAIIAKDPNVKRVGLLSTKATAKCGIYHREFERVGVDIVCPSEEEQNEVLEIIDLVKGGKGDAPDTRERLVKVIDRLEQQVLRYVILGCTELPLVFRLSPYQGNVTLVDSTEELVKETVKRVQSAK